MKRIYVPILGLLLAALAALLFLLLPVSANLIVAYIFWLIGLLFLVISVYALGAKDKSLLMELPLFLKARGYLLVTALISFAVLLLENLGVFTLPFVLHIAGQVAALLVFAVQVTKLNLGKAHIERLGRKVDRARDTWGALLSDLNALKGEAAALPGVGKALAAASDALRYADPISTPAVAGLDNKIASGVSALGSAVRAGKAAEALRQAEALLADIKERNERNRKSKR